MVMPDYLDLYNCGVTCQGKESSSVWPSNSQDTGAAKYAAKTRGLQDQLGSLELLSTACHSPRHPCHGNLDEKGPQNIVPMLEVLETKKSKS